MRGKTKGEQTWTYLRHCRNQRYYFARAILRDGYIRFSFVGGQEFKATPRYKPEIDDNAVVFTRKQEWGFLGIKNYIEQFIANNRRFYL